MRIKLGNTDGNSITRLMCQEMIRIDFFARFLYGKLGKKPSYECMMELECNSFQFFDT